MRLPGMSGIDVMKSIKEKDKKVPVIIVTAYASVDNAVEAMKLGAFDYIAKPFPPDRLETAIGKVIRFPSPGEEVKEPEAVKPAPSAQPRECVWAKAGVVSYRLCTLNYKCDQCEFAQTMIDREAAGDAREETGVGTLFDKLREKSASERQCRYMLSGDISFKLCPNTFQCYRCAFDQSMQDKLDQTALRLVSVAKSKKEKSRDLKNAG
jgi:CheY-like chemotaxis protein